MEWGGMGDDPENVRTSLQGGYLRSRWQAAGICVRYRNRIPVRLRKSHHRAGTLPLFGTFWPAGRFCDPVAMYPPDRTGYYSGGGQTGGVLRAPAQGLGDVIFDILYKKRSGAFRTFLILIKNGIKSYFFENNTCKMGNISL